MIQPVISILIPHLQTRSNDAALRAALECIIDNTGVSYQLIVHADCERGDVYTVFNDMARRASANWLVFSNSDVFFAPDWVDPMLAAANVGKIITSVLVEPGAIPVSSQNVERDFGRTPQFFHRQRFEVYAKHAPMPPGDGWYMPCLINREEFLYMGGFDTSKGVFPAQLDVDFWRRWRESGRTVQRVRSFAFHLQNYSNSEIKR